MSRVPRSQLESTLSKLRYQVLEMISSAKSGHPGGSLSAIDIIMTLYNGEMNYDPNNPSDPLRDRFVLSKGHGVPALYAVMANVGYFDESELMSLRKFGSKLQGHPANILLPGIEAPTGSLGQGLSMAQGMAIGAKLLAEKSGAEPSRVFAVLGDGELQEGQIWEAALSAAKHNVHNLCAFVDYNKAQIDGLVQDVMPIEPLTDKWKAFGWHVEEIDGHNIDEIREYCDKAKANKSAPSIAIAHTLKGKGVSFLEANPVSYHGKALSEDELNKAKSELL